MINFANTKLEKIAVHKVGNKSKDEDLKLSDSLLNIEGDFLRDLLLQYFLKPFTSEVFFHFNHETDVNLNEVYSYSKKIFDDSTTFFEQSQNIAKHLFQFSDHPKINAGEFYVVYLQNCTWGEDSIDAIGLFKTENKDTFLKVKEEESNFKIEYEDGININKLDKGCLIFNAKDEPGFLVSIVDNLNKAQQAQYWKDDFLKLKPREDSHYQTQKYLEVCKKFAKDKANPLEKREKIEVANKAIIYFMDKDTFNPEEFEKEVIVKPQAMEAFQNFKERYTKEKEIVLADEFDIVETAVKKERSKFKTVIKLDHNYQIHIQNGAELIENGWDERRGKKYYTLYYDVEK